MNCTYKFTDASGQDITITGKAAMKAYLANGGLEALLPGWNPPVAANEAKAAAQKPTADQASANAELARLTAADSVTHQDPGEKPEAATDGVVKASLKTAAKNEDTTPGQMRKWLLAEIDEKLLQAPDRQDYDEAVKSMGEKDAIIMFTGNGPLGKGSENGFLTFDVPGDGTFKVRNSVRGLMEFRKKVSASQGFKDGGQKPVKPAEVDSVRGGSGSKMTAITNMIEEGDFEAARDYAEAVGIKLEDVKVPRGARETEWAEFRNTGKVPEQKTISREWEITTEQHPKKAYKTAKVGRLKRNVDGVEYEATVVGDLDGAGANYEITKDGKKVSALTSRVSFSDALEMAEDAMPEANDNQAPSKAKPQDAKAETLDLKGFERIQKGNGYFDLRDGNMTVSVEPMSQGKYQASFRGAKSSPHLMGEQGAVDWAAAYRDESVRAEAKSRSKPFTPPEGYKPAGEKFYRDGKQIQGYAPFNIGERVTMKESAGQSGVVESLTTPDENGVFDGALVKFDNGSEQIVKFGKLEAEAKQSAPAVPDANGPRRDPAKVSMFNPYEDGDIVTINGQDWTVKQDTPGWYLTTTGNWRGQHPTIRNVKAMADLIREVEQAANAAPATPEPESPKLTKKDRENLDQALRDGTVSIQEYMDQVGLSDKDIGLMDGDGLRAQADRESKAAGKIAVPSEFPLQEVSGSYSGISHSGASRARSDRDAFVERVQSLYDDAKALAKSEAQQAALDEAIQQYKTEYLAQTRALARVRSGAYSGFVAGRAKLNTKQADSRNSALDKAIVRFSEWDKAAAPKVKQAVLDARTPGEIAQEQADKAAAQEEKQAKRQRSEIDLMRKILAAKNGGEPVEIAGVIVTKVNNDKEGYPLTLTITAKDGAALTNDKLNLATEIFGKRGIEGMRQGKEKIRALVDAIRAESAQDSAPEPAKPASKTQAIDAHNAVIVAVRDGKATADKPESANQGNAYGAGVAMFSRDERRGQDAPSAETSKVQSAIEGKTLIDAAQFVADTGTPAQREVAAMVVKKLQALQDAGVNLDLKIAHRGFPVPLELVNARGYTESAFDAKGRDITVWLNGADVTSKVGTDYETLLHELVHAATMGAVMHGRAVKGSPFADDVSALMEVTDAIAAHINQRFEDADAGRTTLTEFEQDLRAGANNAFTQDDEKLAWAFSSFEAQQYLETIPYQRTTLWNRFVQAVRTALGMKADADTALSEVLRVGESIMNVQDANVRGVRSFWHKRGLRMATQQAKGSVVAINQGRSPYADSPTHRSTSDFSARRTGAMSKVSAQQIVDHIKARWANAPEVVVVDSMQDAAVPQRVRDADAEQKSLGAIGEPRGFWYGGKVYVVAGSLNKPADVALVMFHEALGHYGLRGVFGKELGNILNQIATMRRGDIIAKAREYGLVREDASGNPVIDVATATDAQVWEAMSDSHRRQAAEEVLAELSQVRPDIGFVKRAIAAIRSWLRQNVPYFKDMALTDAEIINSFILPARRYVERARAGSTSVTRNVEPTPYQRGPDGGRTSPDAARGIAQSSAIAENGIDGLDVPSQRVVLTNVLRSLQDSKVLDTVVELVPVNVVNDLTGEKISTKSLLSDYTMLERLLGPAQGNQTVSGRGNAASTLVRAVASIAAKHSLSLDKPIGSTADGFAAVDAGDLGPLRDDKRSLTWGAAKSVLGAGGLVGVADDAGAAMGAGDYGHGDILSIEQARNWVERGERGMRPGSQIALSRSAMKSVTANPNIPEQAPRPELPETIEVDGVQRPTRNSAGQPIHHTEEGIRNFWRWFGSSRVVDDQGRPLVSRSSLVAARKSAMLEGRMDGGSSNAKPIADLLVSQAFSLKGLGGLEIPAQRKVLKGVLALGDDPDVLRTIVEFIPVDVVNILARQKLAPEVLFSNESVLKNLLSADHEGSVSTAIDVADALVVAVARMATERALSNSGVSTSKTEQNATFSAGVVDGSHGESISQIKTIGNRGTFDPENPDIRFSRVNMSSLKDGAMDSIGQAIKAVTATSLKKRAGFKMTDYLGIGLQFLGRRQIVEIYGDILPLDEYNRLVQQMEADKNEGGAEADKLVTRWGKLEDDGKLADLMHDATLAQIDPSKPYVEGDDRAQYTVLHGRYKALSDAAKQVYADARDAYKSHHNNVRSAIKERIERSEIKGERKAELLKQMDDEFFKAVKGVYFPLARFGQYAVTVHGPDGKVESVSRAETKAEAEALRQNLMSAFPAANGYTVGRVMLSKDFIADRDSVGRGFMTELYKVLDNQDMDATQRAELEDTLGQLYLSSLPDMSWAKHGIHRKGTPGFSQDARRAFAQNMFHGARYLAKLRYSDLMQDELSAMQKHVDDWRDVPDFDQNTAQRVVDEMNKRHESLMNPQSSPLSTALTSFGFVFHLGLSPASAVVNLSQTALVAYPIMGAKWGYGKASAALLKASAEAAKGKNDITASLNAEERAAYDEAVRAGTIDVTMAHDLAGIAQGEDEGVLWKIRPLMRWASFLFHHAERFNRQVTFVASYRLAREAGADHKAAFEQATKATYDGHFDYGACVDDATEILTTTGWKKRADLQVGDVAIATDASGRAVHSKVLAVNVYEGDREVIEFKSSNRFSMVLTPNHDAVIQNYSSRDKKWQGVRKVRADSLKNHHFILRTPLAPLDEQGGIYGEDFASLLGWIAAEGWYSKYRKTTAATDVRIGQSVTHNPEYVAEIRGILERLGGEFKEYTYERSRDVLTTFVLRRSLGRRVQECLPEKVLTPELVASMSTSEMRAFLMAFLKGDGTQYETGRAWAVGQKNGANLDLLQAMATMCGMRATLSPINSDGMAHLYVVPDDTGARSHVRPLEQIRRVEPLVWCPTTEHGTWIARRNGAVFVTGNSNRPRFMQGNVAKVLLLFKQYSQNMVYTLARAAYQSIKGTEAEKAEARKALAGLLTSHAMAAGVLGLPMVSTLLAAASMLGGGDDEPWDAEVALKNMLADTFGKKPAEVLTRGLSRLTPWDISGRVGLDSLIFPDIQEGLEGQRLAESVMTSALGPVAGIGVNILKGAQLMSEGHYQLGLEAMMPAVLRGPIKAIRYAEEGVRDKTGISVLDSVSAAGVAGQAMGFSPSEVRLAYEGKSAVYKQDRALNERRQELLTKAARATMDKDAEARSQAMQEIQRFNEKNPTRRITQIHVMQSVRNRERRITQAENGVYLPQNRRGALDAGRFAEVD